MDLQSQPIVDSIQSGGFSKRGFWQGFLAALTAFSLLGVGIGIGYGVKPSASGIPAELLHAAASHGSSTMAVATGIIDEDSEGIFFLDYLTGDLQCWVYYPRMHAFGAKFVTNVRNQLPSGKNPEYLMVTGLAVTTGTSSNTRPAASLIYVVDVHEGLFAAYAVPWNRSMENAGSPQVGALLPVGGGQIRAPIIAKK